MLAYPDVQILDVTGPLEVFSRAERWMRDHGMRRTRAYTVEILGLEPGPVTCSSGLQLVTSRTYGEVKGGVDTLLVAGGIGTGALLGDMKLLAWLRSQSRKVRRLGSICTGSFLLAEAGLLEGREATTHWGSSARFASRYPGVKVNAEALYLKSGELYTSAGVTAGMDLALALVEEDHGRRVALAVARELVLFLHRPGGQSQFSAQLATQMAERQPIRDLQTWMLEHPHQDLSVSSLARRVAMSERNFSRIFEAEVGLTPGRFVERVRLETARRLLEETNHPLDRVAAAAGLGSAETLRRAFLRVLGVSPKAYRSRF